MPNTTTENKNSFFWDKFITEKNVDLPDLPERYRSGNGAILINMAMEQASRYLTSKHDNLSGKWVTAKTIDDAIFAYPDVADRFDLSNPMNYGSATNIDAQTLGIIVSLTVFSVASFQFESSHPELSQIMGENYHNLRSSFYGFLDTALYPDEISETGDTTQVERLSLFADVTDDEKASLSDASTAIYSITN